MTDAHAVWRRFPGKSEVRVVFGEERDEGAPEFPLILAISHSDRQAMAGALAGDARGKSRDTTDEIVAGSFLGRSHHHVTSPNDSKA
ncbi:MAG: hypothetical protein C0524_06055 [Rhodobacter sp.]|nr:hypothetical protein [Rhodobacter sp.]